MKKLYVLVRKDLHKQYRAVQAGHAVAEFLLKNPKRTEHGRSTVNIINEHKDELKNIG